MGRKKYRIPRKQKKAEKKRLIFLTDRDMKKSGKGLTKREKKGLRYSTWICIGVLYHQYHFTK